MRKDQIVSYLLKPMVFLAAFLPAGWLIWAFLNAELGANPVETITYHTGDWALRCLLITLCVTPLRLLTGWVWLTRLRRLLGLYCFFYAALHFTTYAWLDAGFDVGYIIEDVSDRLYITAGMLSLLMLIPLAVTSTHRMVRWIGPLRWRRLHRLVYLAGAGAVLHFLWLVKADVREPLIYLICFVILMLLRIPVVRNRLSTRLAKNRRFASA